MRIPNRFHPPSPSDEPSATCVNCGAKRLAGDLLYDDEAEHYVCDIECFHEWADANVGLIADYYFEMNIGY